MTMLDLLTAWERRRIQIVEATHGPLPLYTSAEWWALPEDDPRRWASVIRAAACWRHEGRLDVIAERVQAELARVDALALERVRGASHDVSGGLDWDALAVEPTHDELAQRRAS